MCFNRLFVLFCFVFFAGQPSGSAAQVRPVAMTDSARVAREAAEKRAQDSIHRIQDSLQIQWVRAPDPSGPNLFLDSLREVLLIKNGDALGWAIGKASERYGKGVPGLKVVRERWVLLVIGCLLLLFAVLKKAFGQEVYAIVQAFFSNRALLQISKEDNLFTSWPFVFLYVLFGFTIGLFMYLAASYYEGSSAQHGLQAYLTYTFLILTLFALKIVVTRFIGFIFGIQRVVREYVSILYLSYFNAALLFLPLVLALSLVTTNQLHTVLITAFLLFVVMLMLQLLRAANSILNTYRLSKFYLFIYLCTLEIAPVLILIKVLGV